MQDTLHRPIVHDVLLSRDVDAFVEAKTDSGFVGLTEGEVAQEDKSGDEKQSCVFHIVWLVSSFFV